MGFLEALKNLASIQDRRGTTDGTCLPASVDSLLPHGVCLSQGTYELAAGRGVSRKRLLGHLEANGVIEYGEVTIVPGDLNDSKIEREVSIVLRSRDFAGVLMDVPSKRKKGHGHTFSLRGPVENGRAISLDLTNDGPSELNKAGVVEVGIREALRRIAEGGRPGNLTIVAKGPRWPGRRRRG